MKPFVTCAKDYHDFKLIKTALQHEHSEEVDYLEIGCGYSELHNNGYCGYYHAVFFYPKDQEVAKKMKDEWKENIHSL